jgi:sugar phosphate isomerase/epimerase
MKTSCSSWSYHRTIRNGDMDLFGFIEACADNGLDGVEILTRDLASTDKDYLCKVKHACATRHLTIAMLSAGGHLTVLDDEQRAKDVQEIKEWFDVAVFLGAPRLRFFCGNGVELSDGGDALYAKVLDAMKEIVSFGEERGIIAALENHGNTSADQLMKFRDDVDSPWFAFTLDTGNFPPTSTVGPDTYSSIKRTAPYASIVHAKFFNILEDGHDRDFDWAKIHSDLAETGFSGFLSVEYEGDCDDEIGCMQRVSKYLKTLR